MCRVHGTYPLGMSKRVAKGQETAKENKPADDIFLEEFGV